MKQIAVILVLAAALTGCSTDSQGGDDVNVWPEEIRANFSEACVAGAEESGADSGEAQSYCSCVLSELQRRYSAADFAEAEQKMLNGEATDLDMVELGESCLP